MGESPLAAGCRAMGIVTHEPKMVHRLMTDPVLSAAVHVVGQYVQATEALADRTEALADDDADLPMDVVSVLLAAQRLTRMVRGTGDDYARQLAEAQRMTDAEARRAFGLPPHG